MYEELLNRIRSRENLSRQESRRVVLAMMEGGWDPAQTATFLTELHNKGESVDEITGFAETMREKAIPVRLQGIRVLDTCGTGGDKKNTFNISTIAAFVLAGCGIPVVKHGNRAASSGCGSADLLEALGISCRIQSGQVARALEATNFAFLFAPDYHPATKAVAAVRKKLGRPTIFNLLGPLTNPALPAAQTIGVYDRNALPVLTEAIRLMDPEKRAYLIHSMQGFDEATPSAEFFLHSTFAIAVVEHANRFGFSECDCEHLAGGTPEQNAKIAHSILCGEQGPRRDTVLLNAILGYLAYDPCAGIQEAREAVIESIDSGAAMRTVIRLQEMFPA